MSKPMTRNAIRNLGSKRSGLVRVGQPLRGKTPLTRKEAEAWLVDKAETDATFRRALLARPTETIGRELGIAFPANLSVTVVEETAHRLFFVLPAPPALSDRELDLVVGGAVTSEAKESSRKSTVVLPKTAVVGEPGIATGPAGR